MKPGRWWHVFALCWLFAVAWLTRLQGLAEFTFSPDDVLILGIAQSETLGLLLDNAAREAHPPLFYIVLRMLLAFGSSEPFLRGAAMAIGTLAIPVFYFTGLRHIGVVGAAVMGLLAAMGFGAVVETPTLRHYSMVLLLSGVGFNLFLRYREHRRRGTLVGYAVVALLGVATHYSQILLYGTLGLVQTTALLAVPATRRLALPFVLANLPAGLLALYFVVSHVSRQWMGEGHYEYIVQVAYRPLFPTDLGGWLANTNELGCWLSFPSLGGLLAIAGALVGCVAIRARFGTGLLAAVLGLCAVQVLGGALRVYPYGASRHALYLAPVFAFACGLGVDRTVAYALRRLAGEVTTRAVAVASLALLVGVGAVANLVYARAGNYRLTVYGHASYPVRAVDHAELMTALQRHLQTDRAFVTNRQSSMYMRQAAANISGTQVSGVFHTVRYGGADFFYLDDRSVAHTPATLLSVVDAVARLTRMRPAQPVYLFSIGWNQAGIQRLAEDPRVQRAEVLVRNPAGVFLRIPLDRLRGLLK